MCRARAFVETIEIDVVKLQTPRVWIHQRKRGTRDVLLRDTQRRTDTFHENRFARAQWTTKQQDFSAFESRSDLMTVVERLLWR